MKKNKLLQGIVCILNKIKGGSNKIRQWNACIYQRLNDHKHLVKFILSAFDKDNHKIRQEIIKSKAILPVDIKLFISYFATYGNIETKLVKIIDSLCNVLQRYDEDKLVLIQSIFKKMKRSDD